MNMRDSFQPCDPQTSISIAIHRSPDPVKLVIAGKTVAYSKRTLVLEEPRWEAVYYFPLEDVRAELLVTSTYTTYCAYKGDSTYFDIPHAGDRGRNAAWTYKQPYGALRQIQDHIAFHSSSVDVIVTGGDQ